MIFICEENVFQARECVSGKARTPLPDDRLIRKSSESVADSNVD